MKIINKTRNNILAEAAVTADSPFRRMKGLLGRSGLKPGEALVLKPSNSIHTFFMRFPIDVLFVDKGNRIVEVIPGMRPFRLSRIYFRSFFVVELAAGIIQSTDTGQGDLISIE